MQKTGFGKENSRKSIFYIDLIITNHKIIRYGANIQKIDHKTYLIFDEAQNMTPTVKAAAVKESEIT